VIAAEVGEPEAALLEDFFSAAFWHEEYAGAGDVVFLLEGLGFG